MNHLPVPLYAVKVPLKPSGNVNGDHKSVLLFPYEVDGTLLGATGACKIAVTGALVPLKYLDVPFLGHTSRES
jgi:hypothetical protein